MISGISLLFRPAIFAPYLPWYRSIFLLSLLLFFPFFTIDVTSIGYRFFLTGMLFTPVFLVPWFLNTGWIQRWTTLLATLIFAIISLQQIQPQQFDPDYQRYSRLAERTASHFSGQAPELLIAHKGLAEVITFKTGIDALPWLPEYEVERPYRIAAGVSDFEIEAILGRSLGEGSRPLGMFYLLLPEKDWQEFVAKVEASGSDEELLERIYSWQNPMEIRPTYLLRNKSQR